MNYYISDLHFGHSNILKFDNRPFFTTKEMDQEIIKRWNSKVKRGDCVYILGDFCWSRDPEDWKYYLRKLNGQKFLIKGNHDIRLPQDVKKMFAQICDYKEVKDCGKTIILSHYPIITYRSDYNKNVYMFYGHVHNTREYELIKEMVDITRNKPDEYWGTSPRPYAQLCNVGCMLNYMNYTPRTAEEILEANNLS